MNRIIESYSDFYNRSTGEKGNFSFNAFASEINLEGIALEDISTPEEYSIINLLALQNQQGFNGAVKTLVEDIKKLMDGDSGYETLFSTPQEKLSFKESLLKAIKTNDMFKK